MVSQSAFEIENFLPYLLNQAAEECSLAFQHHYKARYGMVRTEWRVLFHLGRYGVMTAQDIGVRSRMHKTKISRAVYKLCQKRFLTKLVDEKDRRREFLQLTTMGKEAYETLRKEAEIYQTELMAGLTRQEQLLLQKTLKHLMVVSGLNSRSSMAE